MEIGGTMREILFRGKRVDNGEWVYGYFWSNDVGNSFIRVTKENDEIVLKDYEVSPETVGGYTGLTDKNGKKIFEGDIVRYQPELWRESLQSVVEYCADKLNYPAFDLKNNGYDEGNELQFAYEEGGCEVIGTIYDNPELLEDEQ